jgi:transcriptional regulatory protein LevR
MKRLAFMAMPVATFAITATATILAAPLAQAQTEIESNCRSSGGEYSSQEVRPHWDANPTLIETCCTGTGTSQQCVTYRDGVQGPTYGGG